MNAIWFEVGNDCSAPSGPGRFWPLLRGFYLFTWIAFGEHWSLSISCHARNVLAFGERQARRLCIRRDAKATRSLLQPRSTVVFQLTHAQR